MRRGPHDRLGVAVDVRALQSRDSADRGIGRYTLDCLLAVERSDPHAIDRYVVDPALPMHRNVRRLMSSSKVVRADSDELERRQPRVLHVASPFEHVEPTALVPDWARRDTATLATVFDVIPAIHPEIYLTDPGVRSWYLAKLAGLRCFDRLVAISASAARDCEEVLGLPEGGVTPIFGAVGAHFVPERTPGDAAKVLKSEFPTLASRPYLLAPLGIEPRKNLDRLLASHASLPQALQRAHPLVIQCDASTDTQARYQQVARGLGLVGELFFTGFVSDATLVALYQAAHLVVFPSLYEGLGLPVLEARRCGSPVICGDNSSLREILPDADARFDAQDVQAIAESIRRHLEDPALREKRRTAEVPSKFTWAETSHRLINVYSELLSRPERIVVKHGRPRLAIASPAPPDWVGPAVYLGNLLPPLAELCEVTLLSDVDPGLVSVPSAVRVERLSSLGLLEAANGRYDEVLFCIGNSSSHIFEEHFLRNRPGAVLLHDVRLTGLYTEMNRLAPGLAQHLGGFPGLLHGMYPGRYPALLAPNNGIAIEDQDRYGVLMVADVARIATRLFVHSHHAADLVELDCGHRPEVIFPHPCEEIELRRIPDADQVVSFGVVSWLKRSDVLVDAMAGATDWRLALVGEVGGDQRRLYRAKAVATGREEALTITGAVERTEYVRWLSRATIAVQLRCVTNGESSGSVAECMAAGVPTVVSDIGSFAELPDNVVVKVPADLSAEELTMVVSDLLRDPERRSALSAAGREYAAHHTYRDAAARMTKTLFPEWFHHGRSSS
jgi:glycosyltransferase involved in cell wall biosynthesis